MIFSRFVGSSRSPAVPPEKGEVKEAEEEDETEDGHTDSESHDVVVAEHHWTQSTDAVDGHAPEHQDET